MKVFYLLILTFPLLTNQEGVVIPNKVRFPFGGPFMGLFLAIALPLEIPEPEVFVSFNFEANYNLPENQSYFEYPPIISKSMNVARKFIYDAIEFKLTSHGLAGKPCLLRAICEGAEYNFQHTGVLADILHVILTPSTSKSENLTDYEEAEKYGNNNKHCNDYKKSCLVSVVNLISFIGDKFNI